MSPTFFATRDMKDTFPVFRLKMLIQFGWTRFGKEICRSIILDITDYALIRLFDIQLPMF